MIDVNSTKAKLFMWVVNVSAIATGILSARWIFARIVD